MKIFVRVLSETIAKIKLKIRVTLYTRRINRLVARGLVIGKNVTIDPMAEIDNGYPWLISIGDNCSIGRGVHIMAHDATVFKFTNGHTRLGKVEIGDNCFISLNSLILPGITIGPNVLVAANSVVNKNIPPNSCVAGVPARFYAKFDEMIMRHETQISEGTVFDHSELHRELSDKVRDRVRETLEDGEAYVKGFPGRYPFTIDHRA